MFVVNALMWDGKENKGAVVPITAITRPTWNDHAGNLKVVGPMGEAMNRSMGIAVTAVHHARSEHAGLVIPVYDTVISVPEVVGKMYDGPSAGLAIAMAVLGAQLEWDANPTVAVSGEVLESGEVVKVGMMLQKVDAADEWGIDKIFMASENAHYMAERQVKEIRARSWGNMSLIGVKTVADLLQIEKEEGNGNGCEIESDNPPGSRHTA